MIARLVRFDPAVRALPRACGAAVAIVAVHEVLVAARIREFEFVEPGEAPTDVVQISQIATLLMIVLVAANGIRTRVSELQLSLPVPARTWIATRVLSLCALGVVTLGAAAATGALLIDSPDATRAFLVHVAGFALTWVAWVLACFAIDPDRPRFSSTPFFVGVCVVAFFLALGSQAFPPGGITCALAAIAVLGASLWRRVPERMWLEAPASSPRERADSDVETRAPRDPLAAWIRRRTIGEKPVLVLCIALVFFGLLLWASSTSTLVFGALLPLWFVSMILQASQVLRDVGHLPVTRRRLAPWVLLPGIVSLSSGVLLAEGILRLDRSPSYRQRVDLVRADRDGESELETTQVPSFLFDLTWGEETVTVTAPDGESAELTSHPLIPGLPLGFLNPYSFEEHNSKAFVAWQLARAVKDAYGLDVDPAELDEEYLSMLEGRVIGPFFATRFADDHGEPKLQRPSSYVFVGVLFGLSFWAGAGLWALRRNVPAANERAYRRRRFRLVTTWGLFVVAFFVAVCTPFLSHVDGVRRPDLRFALAGWIDGGPLDRPWLQAVAVLAATIAIYLVLERRFERLEVPPELPKPWAMQRSLAPGLAVNPATRSSK